MTRALVVGSGGQDGRLLLERLTADGVEVVGVERHRLVGAPPGFPGALDLSDRPAVRSVVARLQPDAVYYLAAHHRSSEEAEPPEGHFATSLAVHVTGLHHFLEAVRAEVPACALVYAASSRIFGEPPPGLLDERTPIAPTSVYGSTKACGVHLCRLFRREAGLRASVAILFNHESPLRREGFVSRRIADGAVDVHEGRRSALVVGDLSARADWGYAPDYVDAMVRIAALDAADDFVVATGRARSVAELAAAILAAAGLDAARHLREDRSLVAERRPVLVGDPSKLRRATGWAPRVSFEEMAAILWKAALARRGTR